MFFFFGVRRKVCNDFKRIKREGGQAGNQEHE